MPTERTPPSHVKDSSVAPPSANANVPVPPVVKFVKTKEVKDDEEPEWLPVPDSCFESLMEMYLKYPISVEMYVPWETVKARMGISTATASKRKRNIVAGRQ